MVYVELDPYVHLPSLVIPPEIRSVYYESSDLIDSACLHILESLPLDRSHLVIGLDVEYEMETTGQGGPGTVLQS